jgi:molybdopterin converting factor subunit 1
MRVRVLYFGVLKDLLGAERDTIDLPGQSTVADLLAIIEARKRTQPGLWKTIAVAVNQEYVLSAATLQDNDEVALLPPVSGGQEEARTDVG